ncbi:hypothetical protein BDW71DRAFT_180777 [Aspergillus fruticulosus]
MQCLSHSPQQRCQPPSALFDLSVKEALNAAHRHTARQKIQNLQLYFKGALSMLLKNRNESAPLDPTVAKLCSPTWTASEDSYRQELESAGHEPHGSPTKRRGGEA